MDERETKRMKGKRWTMERERERGHIGGDGGVVEGV